MPRNEQDPARNTQAFRAFARGDQGPTGPNTTLVVGAGIGLLVIIVLIALLVV